MTLQEALKSDTTFDDFYASMTTEEMREKIKQYGQTNDGVRGEYAKAAMTGILGAIKPNVPFNTDVVADAAVKAADSLIQRLKQI